jgi:hypothetical protein
MPAAELAAPFLERPASETLPKSCPPPTLHPIRRPRSLGPLRYVREALITSQLNLFNPFSMGGLLFDCHTAALVGRDGSIDRLAGRGWIQRLFCRVARDIGQPTMANRASRAIRPNKRHYRDATRVPETDSTVRQH